jgi:hypothetical protein
MQHPSFAGMCTSASVELAAGGGLAAIPPISCADGLEAEGRRHEPRLNREVERGLIRPCQESLGLAIVSEMVNREVVRRIFDLERTLLRPRGCKALKCT